LDLTYTERENTFRAEARAWLEANVPEASLPSFDTAEGARAHREWEKRLDAGGWAMVPWPVEYGGRGANLLEWLIFEEEYYRSRAPRRINQNGIFLLGPTIMEYGTPAQKARFLPKIASSEEVWAQGWSEPNAGSVFRNPRGDYAARLIEACGLRGRVVGDAMISDKHANFIVNRGGARAADIEALILLAEQSVREKFGITLEREVRIVGERDEG